MGVSWERNEIFGAGVFRDTITAPSRRTRRVYIRNPKYIHQLDDRVQHMADGIMSLWIIDKVHNQHNYGCPSKVEYALREIGPADSRYPVLSISNSTQPVSEPDKVLEVFEPEPEVVMPTAEEQENFWREAKRLMGGA